MQITFATVFNENEVAIHNLTAAMAGVRLVRGLQGVPGYGGEGFITLGKAVRDNIDLSSPRLGRCGLLQPQR